MGYTYRGVRCLKRPIDIAISLKAIWDLKPCRVIEIGIHSDGSAWLLADILRIYGLEAQVHTIDLKSPKAAADPKIQFLQGDVRDLASTFVADGINQRRIPGL